MPGPQQSAVTGPGLWALESGPSIPAAPAPDLPGASRPQPVTRVPCTSEPSRRHLVCTPPGWPDVSTRRPRDAGLDPLHCPPRQETAMTAPASSRTSPVSVITAPCPASCGSRPPVRPPLATCPSIFSSSPPLWPWCRLIHQASTPPHPPNDAGFSVETFTNLLVKRDPL